MLGYIGTGVGHAGLGHPRRGLGKKKPSHPLSLKTGSLLAKKKLAIVKESHSGSAFIIHSDKNPTYLFRIQSYLSRIDGLKMYRPALILFDTNSFGFSTKSSILPVL